MGKTEPVADDNIWRIADYPLVARDIGIVVLHRLLPHRYRRLFLRANGGRMDY